MYLIRIDNVVSVQIPLFKGGLREQLVHGMVINITAFDVSVFRKVKKTSGLGFTQEIRNFCERNLVFKK